MIRAEPKYYMLLRSAQAELKMKRCLTCITSRNNLLNVDLDTIDEDSLSYFRIGSAAEKLKARGRISTWSQQPSNDFLQVFIRLPGECKGCRPRIRAPLTVTVSALVLRKAEDA
jgi:hypothetical protein